LLTRLDPGIAGDAVDERGLNQRSLASARRLPDLIPARNSHFGQQRFSCYL